MFFDGLLEQFVEGQVILIGGKQLIWRNAVFFAEQVDKILSSVVEQVMDFKQRIGVFLDIAPAPSARPVKPVITGSAPGIPAEAGVDMAEDMPTKLKKLP